MKKDEISALFETMVDPRPTLEDGLLIRIAGPGEKKAEKIRTGIGLLAQSRGRMNLGVAVARRGCLEMYDVLNCLPADRLIQWYRKCPTSSAP